MIPIVMSMMTLEEKRKNFEKQWHRIHQKKKESPKIVNQEMMSWKTRRKRRMMMIWENMIFGEMRMKRTTKKRVPQKLKRIQMTRSPRDQLDRTQGLDQETDDGPNDPNLVQAPGHLYLAVIVKRVVETAAKINPGQHRRPAALRQDQDRDDHAEGQGPVQLLRDQGRKS
jgi:hypothetical protein